MAAKDKNQSPKFKKVESTFADPWTPQNPGDVLLGVYVGSEMAPGRKKEEFFRVWKIRAEDGKAWSIAGAQLESIMRQIPRNTYVRVTFQGKTTVASGNEMRLFEVECAEDTELRDPYATEETEEH